MTDFARYIAEADDRDAQSEPQTELLNAIVDRLEYIIFQQSDSEFRSSDSESKSSAIRSVCNVGQQFEIVKSREVYYVSFRGTLVWQISGYDLQHGIFGGKPVPVGCSNIFSTSEMFGITVGWKRDMLLAFGIVRGNAGISGIQVLHWYPRDGVFNPLQVHTPNQLFVRYGRKRDLHTRICWNSTRKNEWAFSPNQRTGNYDPCTKKGGPYGPNQYFVPLPN